MVREVLSAVMVEQKFSSHSQRVGSFTIEQIERCGLVRWNRVTQLLECPFVWPCLADPFLLCQLYADSDGVH